MKDINQESAKALLSKIKYDDKGLVTVIAQDAASGAVRMVAYANDKAIARTLETGRATFWSRSRQSYWVKGESSGNHLDVLDIRVDCDGDAVLYWVNAHGPSCHTGVTSCFFQSVRHGETSDRAEPNFAIINNVADVIKARRVAGAEGNDANKKSYVASLFAKGWPKINAKIEEEAGELIEALPENDKSHTVYEAADLLFHTLVGLEAADVTFDDVCVELARRFGVSGITEKASRNKPAAD